MSKKEVQNCLVCQETASGIHYGVLTCEGCKGFFRRAITTNACDESSLICHGSPKNQCNIAYRIRHMCQRCRLQKCFNVGMTRKHSRLGRKRKMNIGLIQSSNTLNNNDILNDSEFKERIKHENVYFLREIGIFCEEDSNDVAIINSQNTSLTANNIFKELDLPDNNTEKFTKRNFSNLSSIGIYLEDSVLLSPSLSNFWLKPSFILTNESKIILRGQLNDSRYLLENDNTKPFSSCFLAVKISDTDIDQLVNQLNDFIHLQNRTDPDYLLFQKFRKIIPQAHMETCIVTIPIMENFYDNKYNKVMVDKDPENVWKIIIRQMKPFTNRTVLFCNRLPDFKTVLPFNDTIVVTKLAIFDIISIHCLRIVDLNENQFFDIELTRKIPVEVMAKNPLGSLFMKYLYVSEFIRRELIDPIDDYEMAFLSALCLTLPGWNSSQIEFTNPGHLNKLKFLYCLCLYDHLLVRKYKGNISETRKRMKSLYVFLDKIKIITLTQADILLAIHDRKDFIDQFQMVFNQKN